VFSIKKRKGKLVHNLKLDYGAMEEEISSTERKFPTFYEKTIPFAIGILAILIIGMFIYAMGVALGWFIF
jgi:hypothetical protein